MSNLKVQSTLQFEGVIDEICRLNWPNLREDDLVSVAWVYYYFSVHFGECLEIARKLYPDDDRLLELDRGERDTDNLSPWPGVAAAGERMNHDEFMRRTLASYEDQGKRSTIDRKVGRLGPPFRSAT